MVNSNAADLAARIDQIRNQRGYSVKHLADLTGIPNTTLSRNLRLTPGEFKAQQLFAIAAALDVPEESLWRSLSSDLAAAS